MNREGRIPGLSRPNDDELIARQDEFDADDAAGRYGDATIAAEARMQLPDVSPLDDTGSATSPTKKKGPWKKPKDMPKRPLSAYNLFFRRERQALLGEELSKEFEITDQTKRKHRKTHGKIGFTDMARQIGIKWKGLDEESKKPFVEEAALEKAKYKKAKEIWEKKEKEKKQAEAEQQAQQQQQVQRHQPHDVLGGSLNRWNTSPAMESAGDWGSMSASGGGGIGSAAGRMSQLGGSDPGAGVRLLPSSRAGSIPANLEGRAHKFGGSSVTGGSIGGGRTSFDDVRMRTASLGNPSAHRLLSDREVQYRKLQMEEHLRKAAELHEELQSVGATNSMMDSLNLPLPTGDSYPVGGGSSSGRSLLGGNVRAFDPPIAASRRPDTIYEQDTGGATNTLGGMPGRGSMGLADGPSGGLSGAQAELYALEQQQMLVREQQQAHHRRMTQDLLTLQHRPEYLALERRRVAVERSLEVERQQMQREDQELRMRQQFQQEQRQMQQRSFSSVMPSQRDELMRLQQQQHRRSIQPSSLQDHHHLLQPEQQLQQQQQQQQQQFQQQQQQQHLLQLSNNDQRDADDLNSEV